MKQVEVKKSTIATYRGLGMSNTEIAKKFGITIEETINALKVFGLYKTKTTNKTKDYTVVLTNDVDGQKTVDFAGEIPKPTQELELA